MLDSRGRDIGEATCLVCYTPATPELVTTTRARLKAVQEKIHTRLNGYPTKCEILYAPEKPAGYGVAHGDPPPY